jgi:hypothetical protein
MVMAVAVLAAFVVDHLHLNGRTALVNNQWSRWSSVDYVWRGTVVARR